MFYDGNFNHVRAGEDYKPGNKWHREHHENETITIQNERFNKFLD